MYGIYIVKWFPSQIHQIPTSCARNSAKCLCWENWICWEILYGFSSGMCSQKPSNPRRYVHLIFDFSSEWKIALRHCEVEKGKKNWIFFNFFYETLIECKVISAHVNIFFTNVCAYTMDDMVSIRERVREKSQRNELLLFVSIYQTNRMGAFAVSPRYTTHRNQKNMRQPTTCT